MLTLEEVLSDFAQFAGVQHSEAIGVDSASSDGTTPLHWMATLGDSAAIGLLAAAGAHVNVRDNEGNTPLHAAVQNRQQCAVVALLAAGASREFRNLLGQSAGDLAAQDGYAPTVAALAGQ